MDVMLGFKVQVHMLELCKMFTEHSGPTEKVYLQQEDQFLKT